MNDLHMALRARTTAAGGIVHANQGTQFTCWVLTQKIRAEGPPISFGTVGDGLDNAIIGSFWSSMQIAPLNQKKRKIQIELANALFEYVEVLYNRRHRHSLIEYSTPLDYQLTRTSRACITTARYPPGVGNRTVGQVNIKPTRASAP